MQITRRNLRRNLWRFALVILCIATGGCGGSKSSSSSDPLSREVTVAVMTGDDAAINDPNGAEGLTPVGAGVTVDIARLAGSNYFDLQWRTLTTDAQGHIQYAMPDGQYTLFVVTECSSVLTLTPIDHNTIDFFSTDPFYNYHGTSDALGVKADAAAHALGLDGVIVVSPSTDACKIADVTSEVTP